MNKQTVLLFVCILSSLLSGCGNSCGCDGSGSFRIEIDGKVVRSKSGLAKLVSYSTLRSALDDSHTIFDKPEEEWEYFSDGELVFASVKDWERNFSDEMIKERSRIKNRYWEMYCFSCDNIQCEEDGLTLYDDDGTLLFRHKGSYSLIQVNYPY